MNPYQMSGRAPTYGAGTYPGSYSAPSPGGGGGNLGQGQGGPTSLAAYAGYTNSNSGANNNNNNPYSNNTNSPYNNSYPYNTNYGGGGQQQQQQSQYNIQQGYSQQQPQQYGYGSQYGGGGGGGYGYGSSPSAYGGYPSSPSPLQQQQQHQPGGYPGRYPGGGGGMKIPSLLDQNIPMPSAIPAAAAAMANYAKYDGRKRTAGINDQENSSSGSSSYHSPSKMARGGGGGGFGSSSGNVDSVRRLPQFPRFTAFSREEPLDIDFDNVITSKKFNFWNLPAKAKVLLVSNIPSALAKPKHLFNLFGIYGDVVRTKILRKKGDAGLVEFETATFAMIARNHLDGFNISKDHKLVVSFSRFDKIRMPTTTTEEEGEKERSTQDFTGPEFQRQHRFSKPEYLRPGLGKVMEPSRYVFVGGWPAEGGTTELGAKQLFASHGVEVRDAVLVGEGKSARVFMDLGGPSEAAAAVAVMGGMLASEDGYVPGLRMTFTKATVEEERRKKVKKE